MDLVKSQKYISAHRSETIAELCRFLLTDTLLYWSDNYELYEYQKKIWQPILNDLNTVFKLELQITKQINPPENEKAQVELAKHLNSLTDNELTVCFLAAGEMKSTILGLLMAKNKISPVEAIKAAYLEEIYQNKFWGEDVAALNAREKSQHILQELSEYLQIG